MSFRYRHNSDIRFGNGIIKEAAKIISDKGFKNAAILADSRAVNGNDGLPGFITDLQKLINVKVFLGVRNEPSYELLDKIKSDFQKKGFDCIIGIGGGSTMDLAKGLAVLAYNPGPAINYKGFPKVTKTLPVITIPTLPGTGSEIAFNAVFTDTSNKNRLGINTELNYPVLAIIDPELAMKAPKEALVSSTMDCLCHATSSFISPGASPLTKALAKQAFLELTEGIPLLTGGLARKLDGLNHLYLASIMANMSLNNAGCGLEGAFSYPLGALYNVPHGIGEGIFLPWLVRFYTKNGFRGYEELYDLIASSKNTSINIKNQRFTEFIEKLYEQLEAPKKLSYGITKKDIPVIIDQVRKNFSESPVKFTDSDCKRMLESFIE